MQVGGYDSQTRDARDTIGYVPQREAVNWDFPVTVEDVVMMGRTARLGWLRFPGAADKTVVAQAIQRVGMPRLLTARSASYRAANSSVYSWPVPLPRVADCSCSMNRSTGWTPAHRRP